MIKGSDLYLLTCYVLRKLCNSEICKCECDGVQSLDRKITIDKKITDHFNVDFSYAHKIPKEQEACLKTKIKMGKINNNKNIIEIFIKEFTEDVLKKEIRNTK